MTVHTHTQIIVNVDDLTIEEKQRVSEALALIKNLKMCNPMYWDSFVTLYGPSCDGIRVGFGLIKSENPTHTPQQVLAMAGMVPDGVAVMTEKRKIREEFDPQKEYSVDVSECTEEEKKEVQQAFFDAGFPWEVGGKTYRLLGEEQYTNMTGGGEITGYCMYGGTTDDCNMTAKEFLELVYEPERVGNVHAESMAMYAEDAKSHAEPWKLWQFRCVVQGWYTLDDHPKWCINQKYRRKPTTHTVNGVEIPDLRVYPESGDKYYLADPTAYELTEHHEFMMRKEKLWSERGLCYQPTEEGKQAAIQHSKAMLGLVKE